MTYAEAAKQHARQCYPEESCGIVVDGVYIPVENIARDPLEHTGERDCACRLCSFAMPANVLMKHPDATMILHSHPNGPLYPSELDMQQQIQSGLTWGIIPLDEDRVGDPILWGGDEPMQPLIGREFVHGIHDCYALIRDTFALGREELARQDIIWPFDPIHLADCPRDDAWWEDGQDLYLDNFAAWGFEEIAFEEARPGDVFLVKIRSEKFNHGGLLIGNSLILHHLPGRLSRREPAGIWARHAGVWLRYKGADHA